MYALSAPLAYGNEISRIYLDGQPLSVLGLYETVVAIPTSIDDVDIPGPGISEY